MLVLIIVAAGFFYFALGALFIHFAYRKAGKTYMGKVIALHRKQHSPKNHSSGFRGFYYCPVVEYNFNGKEKVIFIGGGDAEIKHTIGQKIDVVVLNGEKDKVILRDNIYLVFGLVFLLLALVNFVFYLKTATFSLGLTGIVVFFAIIPSAIYLFLRSKVPNGLKNELLKNSSIVTMEQLKTMNVIWQSSEAGKIKTRSLKTGLLVCRVLIFVCALAAFMTLKSLSPEGVFSAKLFLTGKMSWENLANSTQRSLVVLGCISYAAAMLIFSIVRLHRKSKNAQITSIDS